MYKIYYSPRGFWKGLSAVEKLAKSAKVSKKQSLEFLKKQAIWQIYLPAPKKIVRPRFDVSTKNEVHQADLLFLPHDTVSRKTYKYALTVVDIASRFKEAEPLTSKDSKEVANAFENIYKRKLTYPKLLQVDPGREFMGSVTQFMDKHNVKIRRGRTEIHRDQAIVERFNRTLGERLFGYQYAKELENPHKRNREWVKRLPAVIKAINSETNKPPEVEIKKINDEAICTNASLRYLYQPGELEGGGKRRATDPIWSVDIHKINYYIVLQGIRVYYLRKPAPQRGFVKEELLIVPADTHTRMY
jgi:hypothetical protein